MFIQDDLDLNHHLINSFAKANSGFFAVRALRKSGAPAVILSAFWVFVFSHLAFFSPSVCSLPATFKKKLASMQNHIFALTGIVSIL